MKRTDPLVAMGQADSIGALAHELERSHRDLRSHLSAHKQWAMAATLVGAICTGTVVWGATQFRTAVEASASKQCGELVRQGLVAARAEHGELRATDQRLAEKQHEIDRQLALVAAWKIEQQEKVKPR